MNEEIILELVNTQIQFRFCIGKQNHMQSTRLMVLFMKIWMT
jgi:hypothetical protein